MFHLLYNKLYIYSLQLLYKNYVYIYSLQLQQLGNTIILYYNPCFGGLNVNCSLTYYQVSHLSVIELVSIHIEIVVDRWRPIDQD